jgi:hypothetical protein
MPAAHKQYRDSLAKWKANGVAVLPGNNNRLDQAYVETLDGVRIEILEDKTQAMPIRHEHLHFFLPPDRALRQHDIGLRRSGPDGLPGE